MNKAYKSATQRKLIRIQKAGLKKISILLAAANLAEANEVANQKRKPHHLR